MFQKIIQKTLLNLGILILSFGLFVPVIGQAQTEVANFNLLPFGCLVKTSKCSDDLLSAIIQVLLSLAPVLATLVLIWGGYLYFLGGFDQKSSGLKTIQAAVFGYIIILLGYGVAGDGFIIKFVQDIFGGTTSTGINEAPIKDLILTITNALVNLAAVFAVLVIILGGYQYLFSGIPGVKEKGKETLINGVIGLVVILIARPIISLVEATFGSQASELNIQTGGITDFIVNVVNGFLIPVSAVMTVFFLVWAGFDWITSGGDPGKAKSAREKLMNAIVGLIIVLLAITVSQLIVFFVNGANLSPT